MPIRTPNTAVVVESAVVTPRSLPNNRPPAIVRPDWGEPLNVSRSWRTEVMASAIADQEQRVGRASRPLIRAAATHHASGPEEGAWIWNLLEGASPQLVIPLLQRAELSAGLGYSWPYALLADETEILGAPVDLGGGVARFTCDPNLRRFAVGARAWVYSAFAPPTSVPTQGLRRLAGVLLVVAAINAASVDLAIDLGTAGITFPTRGTMLAPAFDAVPLDPIDAELVTCAHLRARIEAGEYPGPNQLPALNGGDVSAIYSYFLGDPVWRPDHNWKQGLSVGFQRSNDNRTSGRGVIVSLSGINPRFSLEVSSLLERPAWWDVLQLFDSRRGVLGALWVVTEVPVFGPITVAAATTNFPGLDQRGYEPHLNALLDAVGFLRADGTFELARVDVVTYDTLAGTMTLDTLDAVPAGTYIKIMLAFRGRFESDTLDETWITCALVESRFRLVQLNAEGDLEI